MDSVDAERERKRRRLRSSRETRVCGEPISRQDSVGRVTSSRRPRCGSCSYLLRSCTLLDDVRLHMPATWTMVLARSWAPALDRLLSRSSSLASAVFLRSLIVLSRGLSAYLPYGRGHYKSLEIHSSALKYTLASFREIHLPYSAPKVETIITLRSLGDKFA